jgi:hypothetical protein
MLEPEHSICIILAERFLRTTRAAAARRNPTRHEVGWPLDGKKAARIRIHTIWQRHPEFTGRQVIEKLNQFRSRSLGVRGGE